MPTTTNVERHNKRDLNPNLLFITMKGRNHMSTQAISESPIITEICEAIKNGEQVEKCQLPPTEVGGLSLI